ncbi:MAG: hypothetical protein ND895_06905 [Pyrinomonadaceae bacterium]|nr:hypothetical protein [Pyrinomonadaceae bacterium]
MRELISKPFAPAGTGSATWEPVAGIGEGRLGQPQWAECYLLEWEILVYQQDTFWEACFFKWGSHHEHVTAFSLMAARRNAMDRIEFLENRHRAKRSAFNASYNRGRDKLKKIERHNDYEKQLG